MYIKDTHIYYLYHIYIYAHTHTFIHIILFTGKNEFHSEIILYSFSAR